MLPIAIGAPEIGVVVLIILVLFGAKNLPTIGRSLGQGIREFKKANREDPKEDSETRKEDASSGSQ